LEPRFYEQADYIFEEGEEVDEQIFVISRDPRKPINATGLYCVGFKYSKDRKYFHVKLGPKTIIGGYENLFDKRAEFTYKALMHIDAYGLRKTKFKPILNSDPEYKKMMCQYILEYYHTIVRMPML